MKAFNLLSVLSFLVGLIGSYTSASQIGLDDSESDDLDKALDFSNKSLVTTPAAQSFDSIQMYNWPFLSLSLFSIFGILGNFLVCITIKRDSSLQTKTNYYLFSLAITDLAVCVIVIPLSIIQDFSSKFTFWSSLSWTRVYINNSNMSREFAISWENYNKIFSIFQWVFLAVIYQDYQFFNIKFSSFKFRKFIEFGYVQKVIPNLLVIQV